MTNVSLNLLGLRLAGQTSTPTAYLLAGLTFLTNAIVVVCALHHIVNGLLAHHFGWFSAALAFLIVITISSDFKD